MFQQGPTITLDDTITKLEFLEQRQQDNQKLEIASGDSVDAVGGAKSKKRPGKCSRGRPTINACEHKSKH